MARKKSNEIGCLGILFQVFVVMPLLAIALLGIFFLIIVVVLFFAAAYETSKAVFVLICAIVVLLCVVIYKLKSFIKKKHKKNTESEETEPQNEISVDTSDPASVVISIPAVEQVETAPENGKYPQDYLNELDGYQAIRKMQNAHYKIAVIDFETTGLQPETDEIVQVSIIDEEENVLINQLCKPEYTESWPQASSVNGIYMRHVRFCPTFAQVAPYVQDILSRAEIVIAYNYPFEPNFLRYHGIDPDQFTWGPDPMREMVKYYNMVHNSHKQRMSLQWASDIIGYKYNAHDAAEDVKATLHVYNFTQEHWAETRELLEQRAKKEAEEAKREAERKARKGKVQYPENKNADPRHPIFGKTIVITGELPIDRDTASKKAANLGAKVRLQVSTRTQILVCGQRAEEWEEKYGKKSYKIKKVEQMNAEGANIEIMSGEKFMALLEQSAGDA